MKEHEMSGLLTTRKLLDYSERNQANRLAGSKGNAKFVNLSV